jgi:CheY-like chemotaxis protein
MNKVQELNVEFQKYFRSSKRIRIHSRTGVFVVVDDREEAVDLVKKLFLCKGEEDQEIVSAKNVEEAQKQVEIHGNGDNVKAIIIDLGLDGEGKNADGVHLAEWLTKEHPVIPFIFSTGKQNKARTLEKKFPGVDIFIKGKDSINELAEALGLNVEEESDVTCIPIDSVSERENTGYGVFGFVKSLLSSRESANV